MGIDTIAKYAEMAGLGKKTGIDLPHESEGLVPSTKWKMRTLPSRSGTPVKRSPSRSVRAR